MGISEIFVEIPTLWCVICSETGVPRLVLCKGLLLQMDIEWRIWVASFPFKVGRLWTEIYRGYTALWDCVGGDDISVLVDRETKGGSRYSRSFGWRN